MTEIARPAEAARARLALAWSKTRLACLTGGLSAAAGAIYIMLTLTLLQPDAASLATASGLAALLVPLACALPALAALLSASGYRRLTGKDPVQSHHVQEHPGGWLEWLNRLAGAVITGVLCGWIVWLLCILLVPILPGARVAVPALIAGSAFFCGLAGAATAYASASIDWRSLMARLSAMIGLGLPLTMLLVDDPAWWRDSLSYMGGHGGAAGLVFDVTMILGGLGLLGVMLEIGRGLRGLSQEGQFPRRAAQALTWLLALGSIGLLCVGVFPSSDNPISLALHRLTGNGGLAVFLVAMLGLRWLAPPFGRTAHRASALTGGLVLGAYLLFALGVFSFVWFELIYIALLMTWLFFFESYSRIVLEDKEFL
jgi:hypothetical protein